MWAPRGLALLPGLGEPQAALPWQRQDVGERSLVPAPPFPQLLRSLHPGTFKLLALLSHLSPHAPPPPSPGKRVWTGPCSVKARDPPGPSYFSLLPVASAPMSTHVWPELLLQAPLGEPPAQSMAPGSSWQGRPGRWH